ncbi:MAG: hypothetical protein JNL60_02915 [Bacteroidia bacterium]|nr:hypothetical protein [Bacteroidia bacterium]
MKNLLFVVSALTVVLVSCGPAAEDRQEMHRRAKIFQDSIAQFIRQSMDEAAAPGPNAVQQVQMPTPGQTAQPQAINPNMGVNQTPGANTPAQNGKK